MIRIKFSLVIAFFFYIINSQAQIIFQERVYQMDAIGKSISSSVLMPNNRVLLSGPKGGGFCGWCGNNNFLLIDTSLDTVWTRKGAETSRQEQDLSITANSNGFVFASTIMNLNLPAAYRDNMLLQKFDLAGQLLWSKSYNAREEVGISVLPLNNGGYMVGGYGMHPTKDKSYTIMRTDGQGNLVRLKHYDWGNGDVFDAMALTHNGNIITSGTTWHPNPIGHLKLLLLNQNGDSLKGTQLQVTSPTRREGMRTPGNSVLSLSDGGFLVTGFIDTLTFSGLGMIVKVDSNLQLVWKYIYRSNPTTWRQYTQVKELADGTIIALAYQAQPQVINQFYIEHFTANGQLINRYPFTSNITNKIEAFTLEALADSSFIIGGGCYNLVSGSTHYGLYVARVKIPSLAKAVTVTGINQHIATAENILGQSYPNPTSAEATIPYNLPKNFRKASITIREIATGREIRRYDVRKNVGLLKVDLSNFSNGLYFYSLEVDNKPIATKKLAIMK